MKRSYQKPMLLLERFALKQSITLSCSAASAPENSGIVGEPNSADKSVCGWKITDTMILWQSSPACTIPLSPDAEGYGVCYNNPSSGYTIFNS